MVRRWDSVRFFDDVGHLRLGRPPLAQKLNLQVSQGSSRLGWQPDGCDQGLWSTKQTTTLCSSFLMPTYEDFLGVEEGISRWMFAQPFVEIDVYIIYTVYIYIYIIYIFQKTHVLCFWNFCDQKTIYFNQDHLAAKRAWIASKTPEGYGISPQDLAMASRCINVCCLFSVSQVWDSKVP